MFWRNEGKETFNDIENILSGTSAGYFRVNDLTCLIYVIERNSLEAYLRISFTSYISRNKEEEVQQLLNNLQSSLWLSVSDGRPEDTHCVLHMGKPEVYSIFPKTKF